MKKALIIFSILVISLLSMPAFAITKEQENAIKDNCSEIKEQLKTVQKNDARARVHLGGRYETILTKFITPLNVRLVENNLSSAELIENQNKFAEAKNLFNTDYINYQQALEDLVAINCKEKPADFYEKLDLVRKKRKVVEQDTLKLRSLISKHVKLVTDVRSKI